MSFLDLCAWIIAVPTAIIAGAPSSTSSKATLGKYSTLDLMYTLGVIIGSFVDSPPMIQMPHPTARFALSILHSASSNGFTTA